MFRDVPEFRPEITLEEGMAQGFAHMEREGRIPDANSETWEDEIIKAQQQVRRYEYNFNLG